VYEDSEEKRQYMIPMIKKAEFRPDDYKQMDTYIAESSDGAETKAVLYINAVERGQIPAMQNILRNVLNDENVSKDRISEIYDAFCKTKPKDAELYELIGEIFMRHSGEIANIEMQELISKDIYIKLSDKAVRAMIVRKDLSVEHRIGLLEKAEKCKIDFKANDAIISEVLLRLDEPTDVRLLLIKKLDKYVDTVSTNTLTDYIVNVTIDKERKPEMLTELLKLNLNMSFFRDVLNQYMTKSNDSAETKKAVSQLLGEHGLGVDGQVLLDMACSANENDYLEKVEFIQKSVQNGSRINAEFLSTYLERMSPENYHSEIASILSTPASLISDKALANYVFNSGDEYPVKLQNAIVFAEKNGKNFGDSLCEIMHLGSKIQCNLFQGYVLAADDSAVMVEAITGAMKNANAKLNPAIRVNGESVKFKKYINDNKSDLSPITLQLCEANNVFSIFF
jgi:hypothetical protein